MKHLLNKVYVLGLLIIFISCSSVNTQNSMKVENNMSKKQVINIMGTPDNRQFKENKEAWQYSDTGMITDKITVIWFDDNKVKAITSYESYSGNFKTINWEDAPDVIIEKRIR